MIRSPLMLASALCAGCNLEWGWPGGTGVGNPGSSSVKTRLTGDAWLEQGSAVLVALEVIRCPDEPVEVSSIEREVDLLGDGPFPVPGGVWCHLEARFDGPLLYSGAREDDPDKGTFELTLDVGVVAIEAGRAHINGDAVVLELGHDDWLEKDLLGGLEDGTHTVVGPGDPGHDTFVRSIAEGSALFEDTDGDGSLSSEERQQPLGAGDLWFEEEEDDDDTEDHR